MSRDGNDIIFQIGGNGSTEIPGIIEGQIGDLAVLDPTTFGFLAENSDIIYDAGADLYNMRFYRRTFSKKTFECKMCIRDRY